MSRENCGVLKSSTLDMAVISEVSQGSIRSKVAVSDSIVYRQSLFEPSRVLRQIETRPKTADVTGRSFVSGVNRTVPFMPSSVRVTLGLSAKFNARFAAVFKTGQFKLSDSIFQLIIADLNSSN